MTDILGTIDNAVASYGDTMRWVPEELHDTVNPDREALAALFGVRDETSTEFCARIARETGLEWVARAIERKEMCHPQAFAYIQMVERTQCAERFLRLYPGTAPISELIMHNPGLWLPCPHCQARTGEECRTRSGRNKGTDIHDRRYRAVYARVDEWVIR